MSGIVVDLFAGGGGASVGIEAALRRPVNIAINHDPVALAVHRHNHPSTCHLEANIWDVRPRDATGGAPVELLWASPDCTHHSRAKGGKPRSKGIRSLAWVVVCWARETRPRVICVENVPEFEDWGPLGPDGRPSKDRRGQTFIRWVRDLRKLGYAVDWRVLDASEYGAPTKRRRLFIVARHDGQAIEWPAPTHGPGLAPLRTAAECVDWSMPCPSIFERKRPLAEKTLWRIAHGIQRYMFDAAEPFIVRNTRGQDVYPGQKRAIVSAFISRFYGGSRPVVGSDARSPLPTVTAWDHNSLAAVCLAKFRGTHPSQPGSAPINAPLPTISAGGVHVAEVRAFLANYGGKQLTITARNRFGIVTVAGVDYQIIDVGLRMLQPHELLAAQFGRFASGYDLSLARTKTNQIRLIGNSVCPEVAESLVRANFGEKAMVAA